MKTTTRILSLVLALCLCVGLMATAAFAAEPDDSVAEIKLAVSTVGASSAMTVKLDATTVVTEEQAKAAADLGAEALLAKEFVCTLKDSAGFIAANADAVKAADVKINSDSPFEIKSVKVEDGAVVVVCVLKADAVSKTAKAEDIKKTFDGAKTTLSTELSKVAVKETVKSTLTAEVKADALVVAKGEAEAVLNGNMPFVDVPSDAWYGDAVVWAVDHDPFITNGIDDTHFGPTAACTRAHVVTFLWRANGCPKAEKAVNPFTDVKEGTYYYDAVLWAVSKGIAKGMTDTTFEPDTICTRAHAVTFIWRSEGSETVKADCPFTDVKEGAYYYDAVLWAASEGVAKGMTDTTFEPDTTCNRAHVLTFLYRDMGL